MIARQTGVVIGRIIDIRQCMCADILAQYVARNTEQWTPEHAATQWTLLAHAAQSFRSCTAQQLQQNGFHLIILMMTKYESLALVQLLDKDGVARFTRCSFQTDAAGAVDISALHVAMHTKQCADGQTVRRPLRAFRIQSMIDM